jgi:hypothetical protein
MRERVLDIRASQRPNKKYAALVQQGGDAMRTVHFGDRRYAQYRDSTPQRLYAARDHGDARRRQRFMLRHGGTSSKTEALRNEARRSGGRVTPRYLSMKYLW